MIMLAYGLPKAILLDLDDTILMGANASDQCWRAVCACFSTKLQGASVATLCESINEVWDCFISNPEFTNLGHRDLPFARRRIVSLAFANLGLSDDEGISQSIADAYGKMVDDVTIPFPHAVETLETLRARGFRLGLLTNGGTQVQRSKIKRFALDRFFDTILIEGEFGRGKPDPLIFERALEELKVKPSDAWMIGDDLRGDVAPAQRLGILGIWLDAQRRGVPKFSHVQPDRILHSLSDITHRL
jgi:putative hydrolase of the HAD superfamily